MDLFTVLIVLQELYGSVRRWVNNLIIFIYNIKIQIM